MKLSRFYIFLSVLFVVIPSLGEGKILPPPVEVDPISSEEAKLFAEGVLGLNIQEFRQTDIGYLILVDGFLSNRRCLEEGFLRGTCPSRSFLPTQLTIYRQAYQAAVSGHLARNRVVVLDMLSDDAPSGDNSRTGFLVFPTAAVSARKRPGAALSETRYGNSIDLAFYDLDGDGVWELMHTYSQMMGFGVRVIARDMWDAIDMRVVKTISAGSKVSGPFLSTFEGFALHEDGYDHMVRGRYEPLLLEPSFPLLLIQSIHQPWPTFGWEFLILGNSGNGWQEILFGASPGDTLLEDEWGEENDCIPSDEINNFPISIRRTLLRLEGICRMARATEKQPTLPIVRSLFSFLRAVWFSENYMPVISRAFMEEGAFYLLSASYRFWPVSASIMLLTSFSSHQDYRRDHHPAFGRKQSLLPLNICENSILWPLVAPFCVASGAICAVR